MDVQQSSSVPSTSTQQPSGAPVTTPSPSPIQPAAAAPPPTPVPIQPKKRSTLGWWIFGIVFVLILVIVNVYIFLPKSEIDIATPSPGRSIHINRLYLAKHGWLVVSHFSIVEGIDEIAITALLESSEYKDFELPLKADAPDLASGDFLYATLYEDTNKNETFETRIDKPMRDILFRQVRVGLRVL